MVEPMSCGPCSITDEHVTLLRDMQEVEQAANALGNLQLATDQQHRVSAPLLVRDQAEPDDSDEEDQGRPIVATQGVTRRVTARGGEQVQEREEQEQAQAQERLLAQEVLSPDRWRHLLSQEVLSPDRWPTRTRRELSPASTIQYSPARMLDESNESDQLLSTYEDVSPLQMHDVSGSSLDESRDRFIRQLCIHAPHCDRATSRGRQTQGTCQECSVEDPEGQMRGCIACRPALLLGAMMASTQAAENARASTRIMSPANTGMTASPEQMVEYEQNLSDAMTRFCSILQSAPDGRIHAQDVQEARQLCEKLLLSPKEEYECNASIEALPMRVVCSRCEQEGHSRPECTNPCARCGTAWPECATYCPAKLDQSTELLMAINATTHPTPETTDLDKAPYVPLEDATPGPMVATALSCESLIGHADPDLIPDGEAVSRLIAVVHERFASRFPEISGLPASQWLHIADAGQMARICRATAHVMRATEKHTVPGTTGVLDGSATARAEVDTAYRGLRDVVRDVAADVVEVLKAVWDQ